MSFLVSWGDADNCERAVVVEGYRDPSLDETQELPRMRDPDVEAAMAARYLTSAPERKHGTPRPCCDHLPDLCPACLAELRGDV